MMNSKGKGSLTFMVTIAIVVLLFFILSQFRIGGSDGTLTYNSFEFVDVDGVWRTEWQRDNQVYLLDFRFNPEQVEHVPVEGTTDIRFQFKRVYLTIDPSSERTSDTSYVTLAAVELARKLIDPFDRTVIPACTSNSSECEGRPIITCENTNTTVIYLKQAADTRIIFNGNCVTIQGSGEGIVMATNKILFQWLGIMD